MTRYEHELDAEGNKKNEKNMVGTREYSYDNTYQLTAAQYERGQAFTWDYDAAGNREYSNEQLTMNSEKVKNYSKNSLNQYTAINSRAYTYDADGNLLSDGTRIFTWDKKNRMTTVTMGTTTVSYVYDHNDLRVKKTVNVQGSTVNVENTVCNCITSGTYVEPLNVELLNVFAVKTDGEGIVGMVRYLYNEGAFSHYQRLYYLYDTLGSVAQVTAENGLAVQEYLYTPYGEAYNTAADSVNGLRFVGRYGGYTDDDTRLTYFWHRWYDSADGRWVSRDPIGVAGGVNLYGYVGNRAGYFIDYKGLCPGGENWQERPTVIKPIAVPTICRGKNCNISTISEYIPQPEPTTNQKIVSPGIFGFDEFAKFGDKFSSCIRSCERQQGFYYYDDKSLKCPNDKPIPYGQDIGYQDNVGFEFTMVFIFCHIKCTIKTITGKE